MKLIKMKNLYKKDSKACVMVIIASQHKNPDFYVLYKYLIV